MKKMIAFALTAVLALGSTGATAFGSVFADINTVPWSGAATYIDRAQSLSLMNGYLENGKRYCKPRNNVTYCENAQMVYSIMKAKTGVDVTTAQVQKWTQVLETYSIPSWAHSAMAYCLENGYVTAGELSKYKDGTGAANREDVGVVFGRALATIKTINTSATLSYKDASSVTASYVPYLALLNASKIMVGDTDNKFNPKSNINRAEMSVLSVRMYDALEGSSAPTSGTSSATVVNSILLSNGDLFLSLKLANGTGVNLFGKSTLKVTYEGNEVSLSDIGEGDTLSVTYSGDTLSAVTITKSVAGINVNKNVKIKALTSSKITVTEGTSSTETSYRLATGVTVTIATKNSSVSALMTALEDENYMATLTFDKATGYVTNIAAVKTADNPLVGDVTYMNSSRIGITTGNKEYQYPLADNVSIKYGTKSISVSTLQSEYRSTLYSVTLTLNASGYVTAVKVDFLEDSTSGTLTFLNSRRVTLKANGKEYTYDLNDDIEVTVDGKSSTVSKLITAYESSGYRVVVTLDRYEGVTDLVATAKNSTISSGTLSSLSTSTIKIKSGSTTYTYDLNSSATVKVDGTTISMANFRKVYADYTYTVSLTFNSSGDVTAIVAKNTSATSGVMKNIEPKKETIEVTAGYVNYTYDFASSVTVTLDGKASTITKLDTAFDDANYDDEEIHVKLTLNSDDEVTKIVATTEDASSDTLSGTIRSVDTEQLRLKTSSGSTYYDFASSVTITLDGTSKTVRQLVNAVADSSEDIAAKLTLNSKDEITKVVATTGGTADSSTSKSGNLAAISVSAERLTIGSTNYYTAEETGATFSYTLSGDYANKSYSASLNGLKTFFDDTEYNGDICYVTLTLDKNGEITKVVARNR